MTETPPDHGTYARYNQHRSDGDDPCDLCKQARNVYKQAWRKQNPIGRAKELAHNKRLSRAKTILAQRHRGELLEIIAELVAEEEGQ